MDYRTFSEGYSVSELRVKYRGGKIFAVNQANDDVINEAIGCIQVIMEEKPREIGIRYISQCLILNEKDKVIHEDYEVIGSEYNYAGGNADNLVIDDLTRRYDVLPETIDIHF